MLADARERGFLGPGDTDNHAAHAQAFLHALVADPWPALDLGSGAGVPGLVLAVLVPASRWVLLDASERRTAFLIEATRQLGLHTRVDIVRGRAELLGHDPAFRGQFRTVTARSFGAPSVTAECGSAFLALGGVLLVSEPPDDPDRWAEVPVQRVGLRWQARIVRPEGTIAQLVQDEPCPDRYPRRPAAMRRGL